MKFFIRFLLAENQNKRAHVGKKNTSTEEMKYTLYT